MKRELERRTRITRHRQKTQPCTLASNGGLSAQRQLVRLLDLFDRHRTKRFELLAQIIDGHRCNRVDAHHQMVFTFHRNAHRAFAYCALAPTVLGQRIARVLDDVLRKLDKRRKDSTPRRPAQPGHFQLQLHHFTHRRDDAVRKVALMIKEQIRSLCNFEKTAILIQIVRHRG